MIQQPMIPTTQLVSRIGKHIAKNVDGAFKSRVGKNEYSIFITVYYQLKVPEHTPGNQKIETELFEMTYELNITSYANKLRFNIIEISPEERTLQHFTIPYEKLQDVGQARKNIMKKVKQILEKEFLGYDFIF